MIRPTLPPELISEVLQHFSRQHSRDSGPVPTLLSCCLVSKYFLPFARARLYKRVLFTVEVEDQAAASEVKEAIISAFLDAPSSLLLNTLQVRSELGADVESAQIHLNSTATRAGKATAYILDTIQELCPRISALTLEDQYKDDDDIDQAIARFGSQLRSLSYCTARYLGPSGLQMLEKLSGLEDLTGVCEDGSAFASSTYPIFQLTNFEPHLEIDPLFAYFLLHRSHATLTSLELCISGEMAWEASWDLSPFVALGSLALHISGGWPVCWQGGRVGAMPSIKSCIALRRLKLWTLETLGTSESPDSPDL